jgi:hypothetical protein
MKHLAIAVTLGFSLAVVVFGCKKSSTKFTPPDTSALQAAIDSANWYLTNTHEGTQAGEYLPGSQATLKTAVASAQTVLTSAATSGTQAQVTAATANMNAAIAAYEAGKVVPVAASAVVAYWKFNGNTNDSSGNGHNGTLEAGPTGLAAVPGPVPNLTKDRFGNANSAYHFSGGGNIDVPYSPALNPTAMSVSVWVRQDTAGRTDHPSDCYMVSLSRWNGWKFQTQPSRPFMTVSTDTSIYDRDAGTAMTIGTTAGTGPWSHLVATYDGNGTENFYINGVLVKTWTNLAGKIKPINPTYDLAIGTDLVNTAYSPTLTDPNYIGYGGYWTGDLDDIVIYNVALTASQVTQLYNQQASQ